MALEFAYFCPFLYHGPKVRMFFFQKEGRFQSLNISPLKVLPASVNTDANFLEDERASLTNNTPQIIRPTDRLKLSNQTIEIFSEFKSTFAISHLIALNTRYRIEISYNQSSKVILAIFLIPKTIFVQTKMK